MRLSNLWAILPLAFLGWNADFAYSQEKQPDRNLPRTIDDATVRAWEKRGFRFGWMGVPVRSNIYAGFPTFETDPKTLQNPIPTFAYPKYDVFGQPQNNGVIFDLKDLPAIDVPFGLDLAGSDVTDAQLKHLASFKNLTFLRLTGPQVTTLEALAGLKNLTSLELAASVADKRPKGLSQLKQLTVLSIWYSDAVTKELAELTNLTSLELHSYDITDEALKNLAGL